MENQLTPLRDRDNLQASINAFLQSVIWQLNADNPRTKTNEEDYSHTLTCIDEDKITARLRNQYLRRNLYLTFNLPDMVEDNFINPIKHITVELNYDTVYCRHWNGDNEASVKIGLSRGYEQVAFKDKLHRFYKFNIKEMNQRLIFDINEDEYKPFIYSLKDLLQGKNNFFRESEERLQMRFIYLDVPDLRNDVIQLLRIVDCVVSFSGERLHLFPISKDQYAIRKLSEPDNIVVFNYNEPIESIRSRYIDWLKANKIDVVNNNYLAVKNDVFIRNKLSITMDIYIQRVLGDLFEPYIFSHNSLPVEGRLTENSNIVVKSHYLSYYNICKDKDSDYNPNEIKSLYPTSDTITNLDINTLIDVCIRLNPLITRLADLSVKLKLMKQNDERCRIFTKLADDYINSLKVMAIKRNIDGVLKWTMPDKSTLDFDTFDIFRLFKREYRLKNIRTGDIVSINIGLTETRYLDENTTVDEILDNLSITYGIYDDGMVKAYPVSARCFTDFAEQCLFKPIGSQLKLFYDIITMNIPFTGVNTHQYNGNLLTVRYTRLPLRKGGSYNLLTFINAHGKLVLSLEVPELAEMKAYLLYMLELERIDKEEVDELDSIDDVDWGLNIFTNVLTILINQRYGNATSFTEQDFIVLITNLLKGYQNFN